MDVTSSIANLATGLSQAKTMGDAQMTVLKKTLDIEAAGAAQLVQSAVQSSAQVAAVQANNPPHLGNRVNTFA